MYTKRPIAKGEEIFETYGCNQPRSGSYQRSPVANHDVAFYVHHLLAVAVLDRWLVAHKDKAPYYGLEDIDGHECPGHNLHDTTMFANVVPYYADQTYGQRHTWADLMRGWDFENRNFRFVLRGEH